MQRPIGEQILGPSRTNASTPAAIDLAPATIELTFHRPQRDCNVTVSADGLTATVIMSAASRDQGTVAGTGTRPLLGDEMLDTAGPVVGVVTSSRPLLDDEMFEVRIDRVIETWAASLEAGK